MASVKDKLPTMLALAHEKTEPARIQLAGMLADLFLQSDVMLSLREEEMVNEAIDLLMQNCSPAVRSQLVERFVDVAKMPRRIASNLAKDDIDIARPILTASAHLSDMDLIQVVEAKGGDHALAVASRSRISEAVADALVTTGDVRVMQVVAENLGAHLSRDAVTAVADAARYSVPLRDPLLHRPELNPDAAMKLYWWVEQDLRRYALKRFQLTPGQIDQALASTISTFLNDHVQEKANDEVMSQVADWMEQHQAITLAALPQVLRMGHFRLFNMLLARMTRLNLASIDMIAADGSGRGLASACRAVGVDKPGFVSLYLLSRGGKLGEQIVHPRELSQALVLFDRLTPDVAQGLLQSWADNPDQFLKSMSAAGKDGKTSL